MESICKITPDEKGSCERCLKVINANLLRLLRALILFLQMAGYIRQIPFSTKRFSQNLSDGLLKAVQSTRIICSFTSLKFMASPNRKGLKTAYVSTVIGIVMVLVITGFVSWFVLGLNHLKNTKIESFEIDLFFDQSLTEVELAVIEKELAAKEYVSSATYRSADEALDILLEEVGDSALAAIDNENPLNQSVIITLKRDYFNADKVAEIETELKAEYAGQITEISYRKEIFQELNQGLQKIVYFFVLLALMLLFIAIGMINNTIRLSLYSKRFLIKTMQLVGATPGFIRRPFILAAIGQALISGLIAGSLVLGFVLLLERYDPIFLEMTDMGIYLIVMAGIVIFGIIITVLSTYFALRKYLRLNLDNLY